MAKNIIKYEIWLYESGYWYCIIAFGQIKVYPDVSAGENAPM